jgi:hypothetical protein
VINDSAADGISNLVLSGFLRVATHPRVFGPPSRLEDVAIFAGQVHNRPNAVVFRPRNRH